VSVTGTIKGDSLTGGCRGETAAGANDSNIVVAAMREARRVALIVEDTMSMLAPLGEEMASLTSAAFAAIGLSSVLPPLLALRRITLTTEGRDGSSLTIDMECVTSADVRMD
jgi:hypothetical protein